MSKILDFFKKWGFAIILGVLAVGALFALGCSVYTAIANLSVGLVGSGVNVFILAILIGWLCVEIKKGREV